MWSLTTLAPPILFGTTENDGQFVLPSLSNLKGGFYHFTFCVPNLLSADFIAMDNRNGKEMTSKLNWVQL